MHKMSDILTYALLCEEAVWELGRNDKQKLLVARHYHGRNFVLKSNISFEPSELQQHFKEIASGSPIEVQKGKGPEHTGPAI